MSPGDLAEICALKNKMPVFHADGDILDNNFVNGDIVLVLDSEVGTGFVKVFSPRYGMCVWIYGVSLNVVAPA